MSIGWYDPITERWHRMPEPPVPPPPEQMSQGLKNLIDAGRQVIAARYWSAIVATATASQQGDGCEPTE